MHELFGRILFMLNLRKLVFPFGGHGWRLNLFRGNGDQCLPNCRWQQVLCLPGTFAFQIALFYQLFDGCGPCRRGSNSFALCIGGKLVCTGCFHCLQKQIFGKMPGRCRFPLFDFVFGNRKDCVCFHIWEGRCIALFLRKILFCNAFPAFTDAFFSGESEFFSGTFCCDSYLRKAVRRSNRAKQPHGNQL